MGMVFQYPYLFDTTVFNNMVLGPEIRNYEQNEANEIFEHSRDERTVAYIDGKMVY